MLLKQKPLNIKLITSKELALLILLVTGIVVLNGCDVESSSDISELNISQNPVIPALTNWTPANGVYHFGGDSRILIDPDDSRLKKAAQILASELKARFGQAVPVLDNDATTVRGGDIILRIDANRTKLGDEGYKMMVGSTVRITGAGVDGAFYGTRTLLQLLSQRRKLKMGQAVDTPRYPQRGLKVCPCQKKISLRWFDQLIKDMAYLKLNYLLVPVWMKSSVHPEINAQMHYTQAEARHLATMAEKYHITLIPELNAPGHMRPYLVNHPGLQLTDKQDNKDTNRLDITKPEAFNFYTDLVDEYNKIFNSSYWMLGADEYIRDRAAYQKYPQIGRYAKRKFGSKAVPSDAFIAFINRIDDYVNKKGMTLHIWNDGLKSRNIISPTGIHPRLNTNITVEYWRSDKVKLKPDILLANGYTVMNAASSLYHNRGRRVSRHGLCPDAATLGDCIPTLWKSGWSPRLFEGGTKVNFNTPRLSGAHLTLWQTFPEAETENQVQQDIFIPLRFIAQRTWGSSKAFVSYAVFKNWIKTIGRVPG